DGYSDEELIDAVDGSHRSASRIQRELLSHVAEIDRRQLWRGSGARDMAHWLSMRHGISQWKARRWIAAGHALEHLTDLARALPLMPGEGDPAFEQARRADALVALCSNRIAVDADPDRATVVVHARLGDLVGTDGAAEIEGGGRIHPETARRLLCDARVQTVL